MSNNLSWIVPAESDAKKSISELKNFLKRFLKKSEKIGFQTSGTTGTPKKIYFSYKQIEKAAEYSILATQVHELSGDFLCPLPAVSVAAKMLAVRAYLLGRHVYVLKPQLNPNIPTILSQKFAQVSFSPAQVMNIWANEPKLFLSIYENLTQIILGGSPVPFTLEQKLQSLKNNIYISYGMTETLSHVAFRRPGDLVYKALHEDILFSVDTNKKLSVKTPWTIKCVKTNDAAELIDFRQFVWLGRMDFIINSGGVKLHPEELEKKLQPFMPADIHWFIGPLKDPMFGERPVLFLEGLKIPANIKKILMKAFPQSLERPQNVILVDKFQYSLEGKFLRRKTLEYINNYS